MREVVVDTETTGLSYRAGDRVIEVGCVELVNHVATNNFLQFYCNVEKEISESAQKITGITNKFLSDKKKFSEQCDDFLNFTRFTIVIRYKMKLFKGNMEYNNTEKLPIWYYYIFFLFLSN